MIKVRDIYISDYIPLINVLSVLMLSALLLVLMSLIKKQKLYSDISIIGLVILFSLFYGLRQVPDMSFDTMRYVNLWFPEMKTLKDVFYGSVSWKGDYVFFLIPYVVNQFTESKIVYLLVNSLFSISVVVYAYRLMLGEKYHFVVPVFILALFVSSSFVANYGNLLRQGMSLSFYLLSLVLLFKRKLMAFCVCAILAYFSHKSSVIIIVIYFSLVVLKIPLRYLFFMFLFSYVFVYVDVENLAGSVGGYLGSMFDDRLLLYRESESRFLFLKYMSLIVVGVWFYCFRDLNVKDSQYNYLLSVYFVVIIIVNFFSSFEVVSGRFIHYASIILPAITYYWFERVRYKKYAIFIYLVLVCIYSYVVYVTSDTYTTIIFNI